ncbi:hypothetical protein D3C81_1480570 [compost metagenome]
MPAPSPANANNVSISAVTPSVWDKRLTMKPAAANTNPSIAPPKPILNKGAMRSRCVNQAAVRVPTPLNVMHQPSRSSDTPGISRNRTTACESAICRTSKVAHRIRVPKASNGIPPIILAPAAISVQKLCLFLAETGSPASPSIDFNCSAASRSLPGTLLNNSAETRKVPASTTKHTVTLKAAVSMPPRAGPIILVPCSMIAL